MKKILAILLVMITVMGMLVACGNKDGNETTSPNTSNTETETPNIDWRPSPEHLPFYIIVKNAKGEISVNFSEDEKYTGTINGNEVNNKRRTVLKSVIEYVENEDGSYNGIYEAEIYAEGYGVGNVNIIMPDTMPENAEIEVIYDMFAFKVDGNNYQKLTIVSDGVTVSGIKETDSEMTITPLLMPGLTDDNMEISFSHKNTDSIVVKQISQANFYLSIGDSDDGYIYDIKTKVTASINEDEKEVYEGSLNAYSDVFEINCVKGKVEIKVFGKIIEPEIPSTPDTPDEPSEQPNDTPNTEPSDRPNPDDTTSDETTDEENTDTNHDNTEEPSDEITNPEN